MLNRASLQLADDLDDLKPSFSAKGLATLGGYTPLFDFAATAVKAPASKPSFFSSFGGLLTGLTNKVQSVESSFAGGFAPLAGKLMGAASALGISNPLQRDVDAIQSRKDAISDLLAEASALKDQLLKNIGKKNGPTAAVGKNIASALIRGKAVQALLDKAQAGAQGALSALSAGQNPTAQIAQYNAVKAVAYKQYNSAVQSLRNVIASGYAAGRVPAAPAPQAVGAPRSGPIPNFGGLTGGGSLTPFGSADSENIGVKPDPKAKTRAPKASGFSLDLGSSGPILLALAAAGAAYALARPRSSAQGA